MRADIFYSGTGTVTFDGTKHQKVTVRVKVIFSQCKTTEQKSHNLCFVSLFITSNFQYTASLFLMLFLSRVTHSVVTKSNM